MIIKFICKPKSSEANNKTKKQILFNKYMHFTNIIGEKRIEKNIGQNKIVAEKNRKKSR